MVRSELSKEEGERGRETERKLPGSAVERVCVCIVKTKRERVRSLYKTCERVREREREREGEREREKERERKKIKTMTMKNAVRVVFSPRNIINLPIFKSKCD